MIRTPCKHNNKALASPEPIAETTARDWWAPREDEVRITTLALDEASPVIGYWDVECEAWEKSGHFFKGYRRP